MNKILGLLSGNELASLEDEETEEDIEEIQGIGFKFFNKFCSLNFWNSIPFWMKFQDYIEIFSVFDECTTGRDCSIIITCPLEYVTEFHLQNNKHLFSDTDK